MTSPAPGSGDAAAAAVAGPLSPGLAGVLLPLVGPTYGRLVPVPVGPDDVARDGRQGSGWIGVDELVAARGQPSPLSSLVEASGRRFGSDNEMLLTAQIARESVATLVTVGVHLWAHHRRLPNLSAANVALRAAPETTQVGVRRLRLAVLEGDPLTGQPGVEVVAEAAMFERLLHQAVGWPVPSGAVPGGPPAQVAAVAAVIATVRRAVRCGDRHLWGTAALAAARALAVASHTDQARAERDRHQLFAARPDLARTVELVTADDDLGGEITFAIRRTCCLLFKLPGQAQCGTCSLHDHDACAAWTAEYHRQERHARRQAHQALLNVTVSAEPRP
jgi:FhuF 2Fe-2S C-terminal domain